MRNQHITTVDNTINIYKWKYLLQRIDRSTSKFAVDDKQSFNNTITKRCSLLFSFYAVWLLEMGPFVDRLDSSKFNG